MGRLTRFAVVALLLVPTAAAAAPSTLVKNGRFAESMAGLPSGWRLEAWARELTDVVLEPTPDGQGGLLRLVNRGPNDARLCQTIAVVPGAAYRVTARVKTKDVGLTTAGALIALEPRIADSADVKGTTDWQTLELTAANPDQSSWDVCVRLGSYANLNTGTAWFTDVTVEQVGGGAPAAGSRWSGITLAPLIASFRQTPWLQTALPLVAGLVLAFGLGIIGRTPR